MHPVASHLLLRGGDFGEKLRSQRGIVQKISPPNLLRETVSARGLPPNVTKAIAAQEFVSHFT
jgi:hypothetical protein